MSREVWDCFLFNGEWQLLALRLNELNASVSRFVVFESIYTFSGNPKELLFDKTKDNILPFIEKIDYVVITENDETWDAWAREEFQRNYIGEYTKQLNDNDLILLSDLDEIPFASAVKTIVSDTESIYFGFQMQMSYFAFDFLCTSGPEEKTILACAFKRSALNAHSSNTLRSKVRYQEVPTRIIESGGRHLSYFMTRAQIEEKIEAFSHQEFNTAQFRDEIDPARTIAFEDDFFRREDFQWEIQIPHTGYDFVDSNREIFSDYFASKIVSKGFLNQRVEIERKRVEIERQRVEIEEQRLAFISSFSWKITAPARFLHNLIRN